MTVDDGADVAGESRYGGRSAARQADARAPDVDDALTGAPAGAPDPPIGPGAPGAPGAPDAPNAPDAPDARDARDAREEEIPDLASETLARLRAGRGLLPPGSAGAAGRRHAGSARKFGPRPRGRDQWSGPGPGPLDPVALGDVFAGLVADRGWDDAMAEARVLGDWAALVGTDIAAHCEPVSLRDGELRLAAESTAWATQLRLMAAQIVARIGDQVGSRVVRRVTVSGPVAPSWRHGPRTVRGHRGPRDTYG